LINQVSTVPKARSPAFARFHLWLYRVSGGRLATRIPGRRFLMLSPRAMEGPIELRIILNWFQELERLAPHPPR